jgi:hypothetical protein
MLLVLRYGDEIHELRSRLACVEAALRQRPAS